MKKILFFSIVLMQVTFCYGESFLLKRGGKSQTSNVDDSEGNLIRAGRSIERGDYYTEYPMVAIQFRMLEIREVVEQLNIDTKYESFDSLLKEQNLDAVDSAALLIKEKVQEIRTLKQFLLGAGLMEEDSELTEEEDSELTEEEE